MRDVDLDAEAQYGAELKIRSTLRGLDLNLANVKIRGNLNRIGALLFAKNFIEENQTEIEPKENRET